MDKPKKGWDKVTTRENMVYETGDLIVDLFGELVYKNGNLLHLTGVEFDLLRSLVENCTIPLDRRLLLSVVETHTNRQLLDNTLSKHINRLRRRLGQNAYCEYIQTINGKGYKWGLPVKIRYLTRFE